MKIDLKNPNQFTLENVASLLGSVPDTQDWQLRVTLDGVAYLSEIVGNQHIEGLAFRFETWCGGAKCVGFQAEHDKAWVGRIYRALKANWPVPTSKYLDFY